MIAAVITSGLDQPVSHAGDLRRDSCIGLPFQIRVLGIGLDIILELFPKRVLSHADGRYAGYPKGIAETRVAVLREPAHSSIGTGLLGREIQTTVLQKLLIVAEPPKISGLSQYD